VFADEVGVEEACAAMEKDLQQMVDRRPAEWAEMF